jgi:hypothetical protein
MGAHRHGHLIEHTPVLVFGIEHVDVVIEAGFRVGRVAEVVSSASKDQKFWFVELIVVNVSCVHLHRWRSHPCAYNLSPFKGFFVEFKEVIERTIGVRSSKKVYFLVARVSSETMRVSVFWCIKENHLTHFSVFHLSFFFFCRPDVFDLVQVIEALLFFRVLASKEKNIIEFWSVNSNMAISP